MNKKTALIVEDDQSLREALSVSLSSAGLKVITATNGEEGMRGAIDYSPDIVLLDIVMPKKNGLEMLKELRENPETKRIPVIMLSNLSPNESEVINSVLKQKPSYYLIKADWSLKEIKEKVFEVLDS